MTISGARRDTRERLLEAAGRLFADKGYRDATVRDICELAGTSVATINYHFGSKAKLYADVLSSIFRHAVERYPLNPGSRDDAAPEEDFRAFVRGFLFRRLDPTRPEWHCRLLRREMLEPSATMKTTARNSLDRLRSKLRRLLTELAPEEASAEQIDLCVASVIGQCLYYHHDRQIMPPTLSELTRASDGVEKVARHICEFSLMGIKFCGTAHNKTATAETGAILQ